MNAQLNQQLYYKNNLLRSYQQQTQQLKSLINKQRTNQYLKLPRQPSMLNTLNRLETQNAQLKHKLNQIIAINTNLTHKAQKELLFNQKLQRENQSLKAKLSQLSRQIEAERTDKLAQNLIMGLVNDTGLGISKNNTNRYHKSQQSLSNTSPDNNRSESNIKESQTQGKSSQPIGLLASLFSKHQSQNPVNSNSLVIRSLQMQKDQSQLINQVEFLKQQLAKKQQQLQQSQHQVKILKKIIDEFEQTNNTSFILTQNDKLAGELKQTLLVNEILEKGINQKEMQKLTMSHQIQQLRHSLNEQILLIATQNQSLKENHDQNITKTKINQQTSQQSVSKLQYMKQTPQKFKKSQASIKEKYESSKNEQITVKENRSQLNDNRAQKDKNNRGQSQKQSSHHNYSHNKKPISRQNTIHDNISHQELSLEDQLQEKQILKSKERKMSINSLMREQSQKQFTNERALKQRKYQIEKIGKQRQEDFERQQDGQKKSNQQLRDNHESQSNKQKKKSESRTQYQMKSKPPVIRENSQSNNQDDPAFTNSLLPRRSLNNQPAANNQQPQGFWGNMIKKLF